MLDVIEKVILNVIVALYQPFWFSLLLAFLFMFFYLMLKDSNLKELLLKWCDSFKTDKRFKFVFLLAFYSGLALYRTIINRNIWGNPISDIWGPWGLHRLNGEFTTEAIENVILFIPFTILLLCAFKDKIIGPKVTFFKVCFKSVKYIFICSACIELVQIVCRLGLFQISDLFHNTLGGLIGGIIYYIGYKISKKKK